MKSVNSSINFDFFNISLDHIGLTENEKDSICFILSTILNLGNIQFQMYDSNNDGCFVTNESKVFLCNAAFCLKIDELELEDNLTNHSREVAKQIIK